MSQKLRLGVLSTANIARAFIAGCAGSEHVAIEAVASRDAAKAAAFAAATSVPRHHGSYRALLADPAIEAVYIPLPNDMHAAWAIHAAEAGKHVLCEKPLAISAAEARAMFAAAKRHGVHLVEAYPYMAQPQTQRLRGLLVEGAIGRVQTIHTAFGFGILSPDGDPLADPANIRLIPERGGGALLDAGTYAVSLARIAAGERPARAFATARWAKSGVDQTIAATLEFPSGAIAQVSCSMAGSFHRRALIVGERGAIETGYANHAPEGSLPIAVKRGIPGTIPFVTETLPGADGFRLEAESFARMVRGGSAHWTGASEAESIDIALTIEAIARSVRDGGWVALAP